MKRKGRSDADRSRGMTMRKAFLFVLLFIVLMLSALFPCGTARADDYHYINALIGDRASGMGGAYTAVADDASGLFYNPAGIVYAQGKNLSASVNAYSSLTKKYRGAILGQDWVRDSATFVPNYFGVVQPFGKAMVGFSYAVPDAGYEDQDQTFLFESVPGASLTINFNNDDRTYAIGPSIAAEVLDGMAAGLTLYIHYRNLQMITNSVAADYLAIPVQYEQENMYLEKQELGVRPVLGVMWAPAERVSLGLMLSKTFLIDSDASIQLICTTNAPGLCSGVPGGYYKLDYTNDAKRKYPLHGALGIAYFPSERVLVSADVRYHEQIHDEAFTNREKVVNGALGLEYFLSSTWAVRCGLYTDFASTPKLDPALAGQEEHIDLYSASLSVTRSARDSSVSLGGSFGKGSGSAQLRSGSAEIQKADATAWTLFLSSSYRY